MGVGLGNTRVGVGLASAVSGGAVADGDTCRRNPEAGQYLARNDSYHYFQSLGDLVKTGPTNTNVMDVRLVLIGS